jgi:hypothetical protein
VLAGAGYTEVRLRKFLFGGIALYWAARDH